MKQKMMPRGWVWYVEELKMGFAKNSAKFHLKNVKVVNLKDDPIFEILIIIIEL